MLNRKDSSFGEDMRAAREDKGWTLYEFAERIKVHRSMPGRYELGKSKPKRKTLDRINSALFGDDSTSIDLDATSCTVDAKELKDYSIEDMIEEIKKRGATKVDISFA